MRCPPDRIPITAVYSGDANFNTFTTAIYALTVNATATSVSTPTSSAGANYTYGTTTNYTAVVSPHPGAPAFTGTVQFFDGGIAIGAPVVPNASTGSVTSAAILLTAGAHTITAQFAGDGNYLPSASGQLSQNIAKAPSVVSTPILTSGIATPDSSVTFSATASPLSGGGVPTGTITFTIDGGVRPPAAINAGGTASVTATFSAGSHTLSATYSGDSNFLPSSSGTLAQPVSSSNNPPSNSDPKLTVYANPTVPTLGDTVTLLVNVSSDGAVPYGTVQFYDGTTLLATGTGGWRPRHANHSDNQPRQCRIAQHHGDLFRRRHQQPVVEELRSSGKPDSPGVEPHIEPVGIGLRAGGHLYRQGSLAGAPGSQPSLGPGCSWSMRMELWRPGPCPKVPRSRT